MKIKSILNIIVVLLLLIAFSQETESETASENNEQNQENASLNTTKDAFERMNDTIILTNENFQEALKTIQPLLVLFYSNTRDSKRMYQVLVSSMKAIQKLDFELEVGVFNISGEEEQNNVQNISIGKIPEILLFTSNEQYTRYAGLKSESGIMSWIQRQFKDIEINEIEEIERLYEKYLSTSIFVGDFNSQEFQHFKNLTRQYRLTQYRHTNNEDLKLYLNLTLEQLETPQLVILNSQASRNYSAAYNMTPCNEMEHYLELYSTRYYQMFDIDIFKDLTSSSESYLFIMLDPEHPLYKAIFDEFDSRETREYFYNERFIIGVVEPTGHGGASIQDAFEVEYEDCPFVGIMDHEKVENKWQPKKYKMTGEVTMESVKEFYQKWKKGEIEPFFRSQKQTETQNKINKQLLVKKLVGSNYEEFVFDPNYHFVVYYYSLNCEKCNTVGPVFKKLASKFSMAGNIWFGEIDMGKNDHHNINVTEVPELHLYPAGEGKKDRPIHITIKDTVEEIEEQIKAAVEITYKTKEEFQDQFFNGTDPLAQKKKKKPPKLQKKSKIIESERTRFYDKEEKQKEEELKANEQKTEL